MGSRFGRHNGGEQKLIAALSEVIRAQWDRAVNWKAAQQRRTPKRKRTLLHLEFAATFWSAAGSAAFDTCTSGHRIWQPERLPYNCLPES